MVNLNTGAWVTIRQPEYELDAVSAHLFALLCCVLASLTPYRLMAENGEVYAAEDFIDFYEDAEDNHQRLLALLRVGNPMLLLVANFGLPPRISLSPPVVTPSSKGVYLRRHPAAREYLQWLRAPN